MLHMLYFIVLLHKSYFALMSEPALCSDKLTDFAVCSSQSVVG